MDEQEEIMTEESGLQDADALAFVQAYPDLDPGEIPDTVWEAVRGGRSLMNAYGRHEVRQLRDENRQMKEELARGADVRYRSLGSVRSAGKARVTDGFLLGFEQA